jgi:hypothetical protein
MSFVDIKIVGFTALYSMNNKPTASAILPAATIIIK